MHTINRLEDYLRQKLIECGWKDDLKKYCKGIFIRNDKMRTFLYFEELIRKKGLEKVTIDELVDELILKGGKLEKSRFF